MSVNNKIEKILRLKNNLQKKLVNEGLTKKEYSLLSEMKKTLREAPIDYEGPERMEPGIERKITSKETPYSKDFPAIPKMDRDYVELISSKRFKDSVEKVRNAMGSTRAIQGANPLMSLMMTAMQSLQQIVMIQMRNKEELEQLAVDLVVKEMGIPEGSMQFDAKLVMQPMSAAEGMKDEPELPSEEEIEEFMGDVETFNLEREKRRFINSLIQGAAFKGGHMFNLVSRELNDINPQLMNLYTVTQSLMEHAYWLYPDMEGMAGGGGGQMGQSEIDTETDPPTVKARALTFPLLVHELVKGVYETFGTHGLPDDPRQAEMIMSAEDTLPAEIWDSRLGPIFWEKFVESYPAELFDEDKKHIQHYLFMRFSKLNAEEFFRVAKLILSDDPKGSQFIQRMVDDIIQELRQYDADIALDTDNDDDDNDDLDDLLSGLGISRS
jgi:hypothetical protein